MSNNLVHKIDKQQKYSPDEMLCNILQKTNILDKRSVVVTLDFRNCVTFTHDFGFAINKQLLPVECNEAI